MIFHYRFFISFSKQLADKTFSAELRKVLIMARVQTKNSLTFLVLSGTFIFKAAMQVLVSYISSKSVYIHYDQ